MSTGDQRGPDWFADAVRAWTPSALLPPGLMPPAMADAVRPIAELFGFAPASLAQGLIDAAAAHLIGTPLTLRSGENEISLVLRRVQPDPAPLGLAIGQLGTTTVEADDVVAGGVRLAHVRLDVRNLHIQPGITRATIVAAPIHIRATIDQEVVSAVVATRTPRVQVELRDDGQARLRLSDRPAWGHVDATPGIDGPKLTLHPSTATVRRWDLTTLARRLPEVRFDLPQALASAHVTGVQVEDGQLVVDGTYDEWRTEMGPADLDDLRRRVQRHRAGVLRIPRSGPAG